MEDLKSAINVVSLAILLDNAIAKQNKSRNLIPNTKGIEEKGLIPQRARKSLKEKTGTAVHEIKNSQRKESNIPNLVQQTIQVQVLVLLAKVLLVLRAGTAGRRKNLEGKKASEKRVGESRRGEDDHQVHQANDVKNDFKYIDIRLLTQSFIGYATAVILISMHF